MAITSRQDVFDDLSRGKGLAIPFTSATAAAGTAANANAGGFSMRFLVNSIGTTLYSVIQGLPTPPGMTDPTRLLSFVAGPTQNVNLVLARAYLVGTLNMATTGNQFTHDAATFPITRTQMGRSANLNLIPVMVVTTATTGTQANFIVKASGGTAGYTNQDGAGVVGTKTFVMPSATTTLGSAYILHLEDGDSAVQDITQIDITAASTGGVASIYLIEPLATAVATNSLVLGNANTLINPPSIPNLAPGAATSGTATAPLVVIGYGTNSATTVAGVIRAYHE